MANIIKTSVRGVELIPIADEFLSQRKIYLTGDVSMETCMDVAQKLMYLESVDDSKPVYLYIQSHGGSVQDGLIIYDTIKMMKAPVVTICQGYAYSMGAIILLAAKPENRKMMKHSKVMLHDASFSQADFSHLKPNEIEEKTKDLMETCKVLREIVCEATGKDEETVVKKMEKDSFFTADEAIEFGLVSEVITTFPKEEN